MVSSRWAWMGVAWLGALALPCWSAPPEEVVRVQPRESSTLTEARVTVADVADLHGGDPRLRQQLASLDLLDLPTTGVSVTIPAAQIAFRIQLAGVEASQFRMEGAARTLVRRAPPEITAESVEALAKARLLRHLPWKAEEYTLRLAEPVQLPAILCDDAVDMEAEFAATGSLVGRQRVDVALVCHGQRLSVVPVLFEVKLYQNVAVATRRIESGMPLLGDVLHEDRRTVTSTSNYPTYRECLAGKRAKRVILPGQVLSGADIEATAADDPVLIKQRDLVKLYTRVGELFVVATGEALQDGRAGQMIRVRNIDSKKDVLGRVTGRSYVEVGY